MNDTYRTDGWNVRRIDTGQLVLVCTTLEEAQKVTSRLNRAAVRLSEGSE